MLIVLYPKVECILLLLYQVSIQLKTIELYNGNDRWKKYSYDEIIARDKTSLDIFSIRIFVKYRQYFGKIINKKTVNICFKMFTVFKSTQGGTNQKIETSGFKGVFRGSKFHWHRISLFLTIF